ncbi:MAG: ParB N-terminal domain-containing protein [bacterium]|nr:ParB N-terminal domain-containing protein [bacterium]
MYNSKVTYINLDLLKPHEQVDLKHVEDLKSEISECCGVNKPILVDSKEFIILDGHHRCAASKCLGLCKIPCILVDYLSDNRIKVSSWKADTDISKEKVLSAGITGNLLEPKTSRHYYEVAEEVSSY